MYIFSSHDIARAGEPGEITGASHLHAGVRTMRAPQGKVDHRPASGAWKQRAALRRSSFVDEFDDKRRSPAICA
jgi:hypothetical protein